MFIDKDKLKKVIGTVVVATSVVFIGMKILAKRKKSIFCL